MKHSDQDPKMESPDEAERLRRTLTFWHPLLARLLEHTYASAYDVRDEVAVGTLPLRADVVLVRRALGEIPEAALRDLPTLTERLNRWTLIEFKGPTSELRRGDFDDLVGIAHLFCGRNPDDVASGELTLIVVAPALNEPFRQDASLRDATIAEVEQGVYKICGACTFEMWLLETGPCDGPREPIFSCFSPSFVREREVIIERLHGTADHVLYFMMQQIQQFQRRGSDFLSTYADTEMMSQVAEDLRRSVIAEMPLEHRLEGISGDQVEELRRSVIAEMPLEHRLEGISRDQVEELRRSVIAEMPLEHRLEGISRDQVEELRRWVISEVPLENRLEGLSPEQIASQLSREEIIGALSEAERQRLLELLRETQSEE